MKKTLSFLLTLLLIFSFVGCNKVEPEEETTTEENFCVIPSPYSVTSTELFLEDLVWSKNNPMEIPDPQEVGGEAWDRWYEKRDYRNHLLAKNGLFNIQSLLVPTINHEAFRFDRIEANSYDIYYEFVAEPTPLHPTGSPFRITMRWNQNSMNQMLPENYTIVGEEAVFLETTDRWICNYYNRAIIIEKNDAFESFDDMMNYVSFDAYNVSASGYTKIAENVQLPSHAAYD